LGTFNFGNNYKVILDKNNININILYKNNILDKITILNNEKSFLKNVNVIADSK
jgi:hypothetical protein